MLPRSGILENREDAERTPLSHNYCKVEHSDPGVETMRGRRSCSSSSIITAVVVTPLPKRFCPFTRCSSFLWPQNEVYYEDEQCLVIYDGYPKSRYHLLLLPKPKVSE